MLDHREDVSGGDAQFRNVAGFRRFELILHIHRLDDDDALMGLDCIHCIPALCERADQAAGYRSISGTG